MEMQKPRITEIHVRMDCNGCVQKIKKALHGITGIYDLYIDFPQQKLTIIGWADPEKIVKAIKKTRKTAVICSHTEQPPDPPEPEPEQPPDGGAPPPSDEANPQEAAPAEQPQDSPPQQENTAPPPENPNTQPVRGDNRETQQPPQEGHQPPQYRTGPREVGEVQVVYHHPPPPDYGYRHGYPPPNPLYGRSYSNEPYYGNYQRGHAYTHELPPSPHLPPPPQLQLHPQPQMQPPKPQMHPQQQMQPPQTQPQPPQTQPQPQPQPHPQLQPQMMPHHNPQPVYVTHSYNTYKPSPYVTEYEYVRPPPQYRYYGTSRADHYSEDYSYHHGSGSNGNVGSIFSDENPNACQIM